MNSKIANHIEGVVKHPPLFVWYEMSKARLEWTDTHSRMADVGNPNLRTYTRTTQRKRIEDTRIELMLNLKNGTISLAKYLLSFGTSIDCKDTDEMIDDIEVGLEKDEELAKAAEPTPLTPGGHSKVSNKKYQNVDGKLSTNKEMEAPTPAKKNPVPETPKTKKAKKKLSMDFDDQAAEIIQQRFQDDMDSLLSDGFNKSDLSKDPPKPPDEKLMLKDKAYYLAWRLQDLNMEISKTYLDLEDGKI